MSLIEVARNEDIQFIKKFLSKNIHKPLNNQLRHQISETTVLILAARQGHLAIVELVAKKESLLKRL